MASPLSRSLRNSIRSQVAKDRQLISQGHQMIQQQFNIVHKKFIGEFESHPVTRELKGGSSSSNITGSLPQGNLFGFIGFDRGEDPIKNLEKLLSNIEIITKRRQMGKSGFIWTYIITAPSSRDIYAATPMPWATGSSWLQELESRGIPNLGQYMHKAINSSRSGAGFQNTSRPEGGRVRISYVKELLSKFETNLNSIDASRVSKSYF